jgi:hypothetical protein
MCEPEFIGQRDSEVGILRRELTERVEPSARLWSLNIFFDLVHIHDLRLE